MTDRHRVCTVVCIVISIFLTFDQETYRVSNCSKCWASSFEYYRSLACVSSKEHLFLRSYGTIFNWLKEEPDHREPASNERSNALKVRDALQVEFSLSRDVTGTKFILMWNLAPFPSCLHHFFPCNFQATIRSFLEFFQGYRVRGSIDYTIGYDFPLRFQFQHR